MLEKQKQRSKCF